MRIKSWNPVRLAALAAAMLAACAASAQSAKSVAKQLDKKESRLEQLYADYWRLDYRSARGDKEASTLDAQKQIRELITEPGFLKELEAARFTTAILKRRQRLFLEEARYTAIYTEPRLAKLVEEMSNAESEIVYPVGDKQLKRSELNNLIGHEPDREQRRLAYMARAVNDARLGARIREGMVLRKELGAKLAGKPFVDFMLERKGVPERKRLLEIFAQLRRDTDAPYRELLERMKRELKVETVEPWDLEYYFATLSGSFEKEKFPRERAWPRILEMAQSLGYDLRKLPVEMVIAEINFGGGTYPIVFGKEVKILVNRYEGIRFTDTLMHESGHALHYSFDAEPSFLLKANMSEPFDEGCGQIMALLLYRKPIAERFFGLTADEHARIEERYRLKSLLEARETVAETMFEYAAYEDPQQDLGALYNRIYGEVMGVEMHAAPVWAFNPFFSTGPIYIQSYLVAEMFARQVHRDLERRFGTVWDARAGRYLRERYFSVGGRWSLDEILERGTGERLNPKYLIETFQPPAK